MNKNNYIKKGRIFIKIVLGSSAAILLLILGVTVINSNINSVYAGPGYEEARHL